MKKRIIFLDLMRAFAVLLMVQGHTIDMLLAPEWRNTNSVFYYSWNFVRGITAPIFLFTAGTVFSYLFILQQRNTFKENPRIIKGIKRFLTLVILGYLLHSPSMLIFNFSDVSIAKLNDFLAIDVLQLIGFGILFIIIGMYLSEKFKINYSIIFLILGLLFTFLNPWMNSVNWKGFIFLPIANYLYSGGGSFFPLFPWLAYIFFGALFGINLAEKPRQHLKLKYGTKILLIGLSLIILAFIGDKIEIMLIGKSDFWGDSPNLILYRLGIVLILNALFCLLSTKLYHLPNIIKQIGRHTLSIYVVHLIILYGSAWNIGLSKYFAKSFSITGSIISAIIMIILMIGMVFSSRIITLKVSDFFSLGIRNLKNE